MKLLNKLVQRVGNFYVNRGTWYQKSDCKFHVYDTDSLEYFLFFFPKSCMSCIWVTILIFLIRTAVEVYRKLIVSLNLLQYMNNMLHCMYKLIELHCICWSKVWCSKMFDCLGVVSSKQVLLLCFWKGCIFRVPSVWSMIEVIGRLCIFRVMNSYYRCSKDG